MSELLGLKLKLKTFNKSYNSEKNPLKYWGGAKLDEFLISFGAFIILFVVGALDTVDAVLHHLMQLIIKDELLVLS